MRKQIVAVFLPMLLFAGFGSSALLTRALARSTSKGHHTTTTRTTTTSTTTTGTTTTTTTPTTTTTTTTPTTTTTSGGGGTTYDQAIAYTQSRPPFSPSREIDVTSAAGLQSALSNLQAGDLVKATAPFTVTGETTLSKQLSGHAELDLTGVSFVYSGGSNLPAVFVNGATNLYIYGGDLSTADTGGTCMLFHGGTQVLWWHFKVHDCGGSGVGVFNTTAVDHLDLQGEITKVGQNLAWDPHLEKGTGLHGAILWDADNTTAFTNSRFAFYAHDIPVGACVEIGNGAVGNASGDTLIEKCVNETMVALRQAGGSGLELWGDTSTLGLDIKYLEVDNAQGRAIDGSALSSGQNLGGVTVEYGRASNTNQNLSLNEPSPSLAWYPGSGPTYQDVQPAP
jgi:hypothetical protein